MDNEIHVICYLRHRDILLNLYTVNLLVESHCRESRNIYDFIRSKIVENWLVYHAKLQHWEQVGIKLL